MTVQASTVTFQETPIVQWTIDQLYDELAHWQTMRARYGTGRSPEAYHARAVCKPQITRIKRELRRRHLPVDRLDYELMIREQDAADERATMSDVRYAGAV